MKRKTVELTKSLVIGLCRVDRALAKFDKTFTREFPILGKMTTTGISEKNCKQWDTNTSFLFWKDAKVSLQGASSQADIDARIRQYSLALEHSAEIMDAFESHRYVKALAAIGEDVIERDCEPIVTLDNSLLGVGVCVNVFYAKGDGCVDLTIMDGKLLRVSISVDDMMVTNEMGN